MPPEPMRGSVYEQRGCFFLCQVIFSEMSSGSCFSGRDRDNGRDSCIGSSRTLWGILSKNKAGGCPRQSCPR